MEDSDIFLSDVNKYFKDVHILKDISFKAKKGQIFGFLGPNGAGKTTTIKLILGLLKQDNGVVNTLGMNLYKDSIESINTKERIGAMLDFHGLNFKMTGLENLIYCGKLYGLRYSDAKYNALKAIKKLELCEWKDKPIYQYSHGMEKRLSFAKTILNDPEILILDEPTNGVDPASRLILRDLMIEMKENNKLIFMSSHDLEEIQKICTDLAIINKGKILFHGSIKKFQDEFSEKTYYLVFKTNSEREKYIEKYRNNIKNLEIKDRLISFTLINNHNVDFKLNSIIFKFIEAKSVEDGYFNIIKREEES
ncbi:MAG: ABC transporter ATP-binding protein [Methanobrevibacter sp.]|jgi:ABC-2 type transport system ATP-binding protein|nr:ABC transporter ATP-binding protein [Methanobrevibacter sp.]